MLINIWKVNQSTSMGGYSEQPILPSFFRKPNEGIPSTFYQMNANEGSDLEETSLVNRPILSGQHRPSR